MIDTSFVLTLAHPLLPTIECAAGNLWVPQTFDYGIPTIRADVYARAGGDGEFDYSANFGSRAISFSLAYSGRLSGSGYASSQEAIAALRSYMRPDLRPTISWYYGAYDAANVRFVNARATGGSFADQFTEDNYHMMSMGFVAPDGVILGLIETEEDIEPISGRRWPGRAYDLEWDREYPNVDPSIYEVTVENVGTIPAWPVFTINGPTGNPRIDNKSASKSIRFRCSIDTGEYLTVDMRNRTAIITHADDSTTSVGHRIDAYYNTWFALEPGETILRYLPQAYDASGSVMDAIWYPTWI